MSAVAQQNKNYEAWIDRKEISNPEAPFLDQIIRRYQYNNKVVDIDLTNIPALSDRAKKSVREFGGSSSSSI